MENMDYGFLDSVLEKHGCDGTKIIPIMQAVQEQYRYLPKEALTYIAKKTGLSEAKLYGVATFYSQFKLKPAGKYVISVCLGTACYVKGSQKVLDRLSEELHTPVGKTSPDGLFTLNATRCLGACGLAPVMTINDEVYGRLVPDDIPGILAKYREQA